MTSPDVPAPPSAPSATWEQRWHPLREEWVIVAAHRQDRPWNGHALRHKPRDVPPYDPGCYLCPGNRRISGLLNPAYTGVYVFDNDHPCVGPLAPTDLPAPPPPYRNAPARGIARVVCFSPRHDLQLAEMPEAAVTAVVQTWQQQSHDLGQRPEVRHVLCFENKGEIVGVSNPHPHGQIYATSCLLRTMEIELLAQQRYEREAGRALFGDIIAAERQDDRRMLYDDGFAVAFVPYFARYAYEVYVAPVRTVSHLTALTDAEAAALARALHNVAIRFDNLWRMSFPYVLAVHQAPTDGADYRAFHTYISIHPPLRSPNLLKYLAGPEIGAGTFLSDTSPEDKAAELRAVPSVHYRQTEGAS
jgi:UDPglucose--hexose-1-phosphate uridylyltransferase